MVENRQKMSQFEQYEQYLRRHIFETFLKCQSSPIQKCRAIEIFILPVLRSRVWGHFPENQMVRGLI